MRRSISLTCLLLTLGPPLLAVQEEFVPGTHVPPTAGEVAKPLGTIYWYDQGPEGRVPTLAELRGNVVLVHTWGYYCGPCMKKGVPYVVDLMEANREQGLRALSITVPVTDDKPDDHFVSVAHEMGMKHPLGTADGFGGMSPYVNMNVSKGLTWCFVVGREGGVRWSGDPSIDDEDFLEAVRAALAEEPAPPLEEGTPESLAKAVAQYVAGDLERARDEVLKVEAKLARKEDQQEALAHTRRLLAAIEAHRSELEQGLEEAVDASDAERFVACERMLSARFGRGSKKLLKELDRRLAGDEHLAADVERWRAWDALRVSRPALFPARDDKACRNYAKELSKYVEGAPEDLPGLARSRALLEAFGER